VITCYEVSKSLFHASAKIGVGQQLQQPSVPTACIERGHAIGLVDAQTEPQAGLQHPQHPVTKSVAVNVSSAKQSGGEGGTGVPTTAELSMGIGQMRLQTGWQHPQHPSDPVGAYPAAHTGLLGRQTARHGVGPIISVCGSGLAKASGMATMARAMAKKDFMMNVLTP